MRGPLPSELGTLSLLGDMSVLIYFFKKKKKKFSFYLPYITHAVVLMEIC